jgi:hypothetical protein
MVEQAGNIHLGSERIAEYVFLDNGMAIVSIGRFAEELKPKSVQVFNTWQECQDQYPKADFRPFFDRKKQKKER